MQEFNYIQKYWFEDYLITQNCGYDKNVGEYNGFTIYRANKEMKYEEVLHGTLSGSNILTKQELEDKIKNYEILEENTNE
jgi:predicted peroxiredoxin